MMNNVDPILYGTKHKLEVGLAWMASVAAIYAGFLGLGWPNHPYQIALGTMAVALAYHRGWLPFSRRLEVTALLPFNVLMMALLFKLFIGSGKHLPLAWLQRPELKVDTVQGKWYEVFPQIGMIWRPTEMAAWEIDLTLVQTFLLIVTLIGAVARFQPFTSLTAVMLIIASIPAFASFDWTWVFPAMMAATVSFYLQSVQPR